MPVRYLEEMLTFHALQRYNYEEAITPTKIVRI